MADRDVKLMALKEGEELLEIVPGSSPKADEEIQQATFEVGKLLRGAGYTGMIITTPPALQRSEGKRNHSVVIVNSDREGMITVILDVLIAFEMIEEFTRIAIMHLVQQKTFENPDGQQGANA